MYRAPSRAVACRLYGEMPLLGRAIFALAGRTFVHLGARSSAKIRSMKPRSPVAEQLGKRVAKLRMEIGMGQKQLASDAGTTVKVISQLERGVSVPPVEKLDKIADVLIVQLVDLFNFDWEMNDRRYDLFVQIGYMLRNRTAADLEAVRDMLRLVFQIKRRERPNLPPRRRSTR